MTPQVLTSPEDVRRFTAGLARQEKRLALVPTMGFLHEGHLSLMREGLARADAVAVSIFVNPAQFGPREDLSRYPRDREGDLRRCASVGVAAVYAPPAELVYPANYQTWVEVAALSQGLCGERRPGHFRGVATVVAKLLSLFRPAVALFGEKDYQQLQVIRQLNRDLELGVDIVGLPTVREPDGLAMSSRNSYLTADERHQALALSRALSQARALVAAGQRDTRRLAEAMAQVLGEAGVRMDYAEVRHAETLEPIATLAPGVPARALIAGFVGTTRLIDNGPLAAP